MKENVKSEEAVKIKETKSEDVKTDEVKTANTSKCECCCHKKKERSEKEYKDLIHRLNRIEGQIRGIKRMVEEDAYCPDILVLLSIFIKQLYYILPVISIKTSFSFLSIETFQSSSPPLWNRGISGTALSLRLI